MWSFQAQECFLIYTLFSFPQKAKHYEAGGESTCSDVSDLWNKTQRQWSVHFRCHVVPKDTFLLGAFTSVIFLLPVIFYISMYINSEVKRQSIDRMKVSPWPCPYISHDSLICIKRLKRKAHRRMMGSLIYIPFSFAESLRKRRYVGYRDGRRPRYALTVYWAYSHLAF